ncbi:hypothetical protein [Tenacibaculum amylolyticum]|uniref:hypothetical protein n=1 Tax=Tenacibaculum amylolyticum TaxID=104269 RepID=UPI003895CB51
MKKTILNLGKALAKKEQQTINGGVKGGDGVINPIPIGSGCSDGSIPTFTCINNSIVGYCQNGQVISGNGGHCL